MYKQTLHITWVIGLILGIILEGLQFLVSNFIGTNFRVIDINDVIFNCTGVILGWCCYTILKMVYLKIMDVLHIEKNAFLDFCFDRKACEDYVKMDSNLSVTDNRLQKHKK